MSSNSNFYWKMAQRRMPAMAALFLLCTGVAIALALKLPTTYSATARLLVEPPQISGMEVVQVTDDAAQLEIIQQRLMVRSNLIDIADRRSVFPDRGSMSADEIVEEMREKTLIERSSGRNQATLMSISFEAGEAKTSADVVNDYVTLITQENVRIRTGRAEDNLAFFNQEITRLSTDLDLQSERILTFKTENADALPEDQTYRLTRLGDLQERIARVEREISSLEQRRESILSVYEATGNLSQNQNAQLTPEQRQLQNLQGELSGALAIYSEENPRVKVLKSRIAQLETVVNSQIGLETDTSDPAAQQSALLQLNLADIDTQIENLRSELVQANAELAGLRDAIERTPANQIALDALERDYDNLQIQYNAAVERGNNARMGEQIELGSKGQRITLIEPATVPNLPASPNRPLISIAGVAAGLGMAGGLFFLLEILNRTARRPIELTNALGITPLATIPYMEDERNKLLRRSRLVMSFLIVVIGMPAALWMIDTFYQPLDLIIENLIEKLGLG